MANIILNTGKQEGVIDSAIPYSEFDPQSISLTQVKEVLKLYEESDESFITIDGSNPSLHQHFDEIMLMVSANNNIKRIKISLTPLHPPQQNELIYILSLKQDLEVLLDWHPKMSIEGDVYDKWMTNAKTVASMNSVKTGMNVYVSSHHGDYSKAVEFASRIGINRLTVELAPQLTQFEGGIEDYLEDLSDPIYELYEKAAKEDINVISGRSHFPTCFLDPEQSHQLNLMGVNLKNQLSPPPIDILPDMTAIRSYDVPSPRIDIRNFADIESARAFFSTNIDQSLHGEYIFERCSDCPVFDRAGRTCASVGLWDESR